MAAEQKTVEPKDIEAEEPANNDEESQPSCCSAKELDYELGMSSRAGAVKEHLLSKTEVTAILLKADGTSEEIKSGASSQQIRSLLSGKVTVVGEIEELHIVVLRSADSSVSLNKHQLPVPLCHGSFNGDYLLIRMDTTGKPVDLSLAEYTKYVETHKTLTETAIKNFSTESLQIKSRSPFGTEAKDLRMQLMAEIECKLRGDKDDDTAPSDSQIYKAVETAILELVDNTIAGWSASPMEDPDYVQEDEATASRDTNPTVEQEEESTDAAVEELDGRSWRDQLNDALQHVREIGKADGQVFAQRLSETFYEINGEQPSANQMQTMFSNIKNDFAVEAAQERNEENVEQEVQEQPALDGINEEEEDEETSPEGSEAEEVDDAVAQQEDDDVVMEEEEDEDEMSPLETLKFATKTIGNDWVSRAQNMWRNQRGREPTEREFAHTVKQLAQDFADSVLDITEEAVEEYIKNTEDEECSKEQDQDEDYDPDNVDDVEMAEVDATENQRYDDFHFDDLMLTTPVVQSKKDSGCSWKVYFEESELSEVVETANLEEAISNFKAVNKRDPTALEVHNMKMFLSVPNEVGDEMEDDIANVITTQTGNASWNVSFEGDEISALKAARNLKDAVKAFKLRNSREPTRSEMAHIRSFVGGQKSTDVAEKEVSRSPSKVLVTPVKQSRSGSVALNVYLEGNRYSQQESEQLAVRCFAKFNKRDPNKEEMERIRAFIKADAELTEQTYLVPEKMGSLTDVLLVDEVVCDDQKETDIPARASTKKKVTKKTATGYLLDFEDETKREHGDEKMAKQWFQRFNNREPNEEEEEQINQFVAAERVDQEHQQIIDID